MDIPPQPIIELVYYVDEGMCSQDPSSIQKAFFGWGNETDDDDDDDDDDDELDN